MTGFTERHPRQRLFWAVIALLSALSIGGLLAGCEAAATALDAAAQPDEQPLLTTPTAAPTATPSALDRTVARVAQQTGLEKVGFLGLNGEDLVNLLISILIVALGAVLGALALKILVLVFRRIRHPLDKQLAQVIAAPLKWVILLAALDYAIARLAFLSPGLKQTLNLVVVSLIIALLSHSVWKLADHGLERAFTRLDRPLDEGLKQTMTPFLRRSIQAVIYLIGLAIILQNFGVNLSAIFAVLGIGGLAISLAIKETLSDMISGFIILIDRPFRIGDRIKIDSMDTWGDVEDIRARTTHIRTPDNRLVVIPNSTISRSMIENFTYPDPSHILTLDVGVAYGSDLEKASQVILQALRSVPGLHEDRQPSVDLIEYGDSNLHLRLTYWLKSYRDMGLRNLVNRSVFQALVEAGIEMPNITYDVNLAYKPHNGPDTEPANPGGGLQAD